MLRGIARGAAREILRRGVRENQEPDREPVADSEAVRQAERLFVDRVIRQDRFAPNIIRPRSPNQR